MTRGSALAEVLVIGGLVVVMVASALAASGIVLTAGEAAVQTADIAATWSARHGDTASAVSRARFLAPEATEISAHIREDAMHVTVRLPYELPGGLRGTVTGRAVAGISPYRSNRG